MVECAKIIYRDAIMKVCLLVTRDIRRSQKRIARLPA